MNENHNPWKVIKEKKIYNNPWIDVIEYDVINPGGGTGIYGKVHFKNIAIGILPLDEDLNTYLVGQYRFALGQYSWEIPEGGGPIDTDPLESAKRELKEETGLVAKDWSQLIELHNSNSVTDEYARIYLARKLEQHTPAPEETEQLVLKKIRFEEVYKMVEEGIITDAMTAVAVLKVKLMLIERKIS